MTQYPLDHRRVFNTRDSLDRAAAGRAGFDVHLENPLEALRPPHRRLSLGRCAFLFSRRLNRPGTSAPPGRRDPGPIGAVGRENPVEACEIQARRWHQCGEPRDEVERLEDQVGCSVAVGRFQRVADVAARGYEQPLFRHRRAADVAAQPFEFLALANDYPLVSLRVSVQKVAR